MSCQGFLQCILKLINFLLTLVGAYMIVYSLWMYKEWNSMHHHHHEISSPYAPALLSSGISSGDISSGLLGQGVLVEQLARPLLKESLKNPDVPAPWFIYAFFGAGAITCFVSLTVAGLLFFDRHWREDVPDDPTGQLDKVQKFVVENLDICKWIALGVVLLEVLGLFFAFILRAISSSPRRNYDSDDGYMVPRPAPRQPANNRQAPQAVPAPSSGAGAEARAPRTDAWSTRMREKYGLDTTEFTANPSESRRFAQPNQTPGAEEPQSRCVIM